MTRTAVSHLRKQLNTDNCIQLINKTRLFSGISVADLSMTLVERICDEIEVIPLRKNHSLPIEMRGGEPIYVYEILSGYVKIYDRRVSRSEERSGSRKSPPALLAWRVPQELLGDFQLTLSDETPDDHIVATDDCRLLRLPASLIRDLAEVYPQIYLNIARNLASKAVKGRVRAQLLQLPNAESMVARLFIELLEERKAIKDADRCLVVNGTFRINDIAAFLGHGPRSIQAGMAKLMDRKLIAHHGSEKSGRFKICRLKGLRELLETELSQAAQGKKPPPVTKRK